MDGPFGAKIDVLVDDPGGQPVAVETKFSGGSPELRAQVEERLGCVLEQSGSLIESGVSVVYPDGLYASELETSVLGYAMHELDEDGSASRWPEGDDTCKAVSAATSTTVSTTAKTV